MSSINLRLNKSLSASLLRTVTAALLFGGARGATASTGVQFVTLRNRAHYDRSLSYAAVQADPSKYVGRVLELNGRVSGTIGSRADLSIMLNLADDSAPTLDIPPSEAPVVQEFANPVLRVLVKVEPGGGGNVVPLKVLAVADESAVSAIEKEAAVDQAADRKRREQESWMKRAERAVHTRNVGVSVARGSFARLIPGQAGDFSGSLSARARPLFTPYYNYIAQCNSRLTAAEVGRITYHLLNFADRYDVDPRLVVSMIIAESGFDPNSTSRTGAMGLGQLMPSTARDLGVQNPYDPIQNLGGSIAYLRERLDTFSERAMPGGGMSFEQAALAMAAYNAGPNAVKKYHGIPPYRETQAYVRRVMSLYQQLCR